MRPARPAPLLDWPELERIRELRRVRDALRARMLRMPPRSRRRLHAEDDLATITLQILAAELSLWRSR